MNDKYSFILILALLSSGMFYRVCSQDVNEWRGPGRTGVYAETELLSSWPEGGPELLWVVEDLPNGYSSVTIANNRIFLTGIQDTLDVLVALNMDGKVQWQTPYGLSWPESYNPSRSTPTFFEDKLYVSSGFGDVACVDAQSGHVVWKVEASEEYKGIYARWGYAESLAVMDNKVFFTPGGNETTMIALDINSGNEIWASESLNDTPSFASPLVYFWDGKPTIVNATENFYFGIDPMTGEMRWTFDFGSYAGGESKRNNQTNTPIFDSGKLFITSGYDHKCVQLQLSEDGNDVSVNWVDSTLDVHHGGVVKIGDYLYGASWEGNRMGNWVCLDWTTGQAMYETEWENKGSIISADGMLYCYEEKNGNIALVPASPDQFEIVSTFKITHGKGPHWSHPVIHNKRLYVRHGKALMVYSLAL